MDGKVSATYNCKLHYISYWRHFGRLLKSPLPVCKGALGAFTLLIVPTEIVIQFSGHGEIRWLSCLILAALSVLGSSAINAWRYYNHVPVGFEGESRNACRIAQMQRPRWEFKLAQTLLAAKLGPFDRELRELNEGRRLVQVSRVVDSEEYWKWAMSRSANFIEMLKTATRLMTSEIQGACSPKDGKPPQPCKILEAAETLAGFYGETVAFERDARTVKPPEHLSEFYPLQTGWSESIQRGVCQMFQILQQICDCDLKSDHELAFSIEIDAPRNVTAYANKLEEMSDRPISRDDL